MIIHRKMNIVFSLCLCCCSLGCLSNSTPINHFSVMSIDGYEFISIPGASQIDESLIVKVTGNCKGSAVGEIIKKLGVRSDAAKSTIDYIKMRKVIISIHLEGDESNVYATLGVDQAICSFGRDRFLDKYDLDQIYSDLEHH